MGKKPYEIFQELESARLKVEYDEIIKQKSLSPQRLWEISDENFYKWSKKHYYSKVLDFFKENLNRFDVWQRTWRFTDDKILSYGLTNCIGPKKYDKNPYRYIIQGEGYQGKSRFISDTNLHGKIKHGGPYFTTKYTKIDSFIPYLDWVNLQNNSAHEKIVHNDLLFLSTISSPNTADVQVQILDNLYLLKMGGLTAPLDHNGLLSVKRLEFVNLSNLRLTGNLSTQNKLFSIENSFVENLLIEDCELGLVRLYRCRIRNIKVINSKLGQWDIIECLITGDISKSELIKINFQDCTFNVPIRNCSIYDVNMGYKIAAPHASEGYKILKTAYNNQGDDSSALYFFLKEKENERALTIINYKRNIQKLFVDLSKNKFPIKKFPRVLLFLLKTQTLLFKYAVESLNYHYWGYGRKPMFVFRNSILIVLAFALFYVSTLCNWQIENFNFTLLYDSLLISLSSFSTLGWFSDKVMLLHESAIILESIVGALSIGAFIGSLAVQKY